MKAAFLTGIGKIEILDTPDAKLESPDYVLLQMHTVGICGSDVHCYRNGRIAGQSLELPFMVGHECAGKVVETGPEVKHLRVGDRVAVDPLIPCGQCDQCLAGRQHTCRNQQFLGAPGQIGGALVEYVAMPATCCVPVPKDMTMTQATLTEPFAVGLHAQRLAGEVAGASAAVLGSGPIGLCVLLALRTAGAAGLYATDLLENRLELAARLGADWTGDPEDEDIVAAICRREPLGVDYAFECAGEQETLDQCIELLKPGGTLLSLGIPEEDRVSIDPHLMRRHELRIQNVRRQNECVETAIELVASGKVNLDPLVTHELPLDRTDEAFDMVADYRDGVVKAMIRVSGTGP